MNQTKNVQAMLTPEAHTIRVLFSASVRSDAMRTYKYVTTHTVKVGDWVVVPVPAPVIHGSGIAAIVRRYTQDYTGTPLLPDGKVPAAALVVAVDDYVDIYPDDTMEYAWTIQNSIDVQQYEERLSTGAKIVATLETCHKNKQKAASKLLAKEIRATILASLPSKAASKLAALTGG